MSLVLVIFGLVTFNKIPLRELPDVDSAKINIRTDYTGASAVIVDTQITQKIEDRIGGTPELLQSILPVKMVDLLLHLSLILMLI